MQFNTLICLIQAIQMCPPGLLVKNAEEKCGLRSAGITVQKTFSRKRRTARQGGFFITTAQFSKEAVAYAKKQHTTKVILVDGITLTNLMIEYNLGVSTETVYEIKRMDTDFFSDENI